jgi:hypothetical protein
MADYIVIHSVRVAQEFVPETFGRLTTIGPKFLLTGKSGKRIGGKRSAYHVCQCCCGELAIVARSCLQNGHTQSCGCLQKQRASETRTKHGLRKIREYKVWKSMIIRCGNPNHTSYADYGGRGIRVCDRWLDPENGLRNFLSDMGTRPSPGLSLNRIDNNGNYCPDNCEWTTQREQSRNRRSNIMLTYNGKTQCVTDWSTEFGLHNRTIISRLKAGWTVEAAITTPGNKKKRANDNPTQSNRILR